MAAFDASYYAGIEESCRQSARAVVPQLVKALRPRSVVDVGCGVGCWLAEFLRSGVPDVLGIDGPWVQASFLQISRDRFLGHDLTNPLSLPRQFDLVLCLEVAECLPEAKAESLVQSLAALGPVIIFSAAVPGQGGQGHVNEQPPEWWDRKFTAQGFRPVRGFGAQFLDDCRVSWWYARNMVFYVREGTNCPAELSTGVVNGSSSLVGDGSPKRGILLDKIAPVVLTCARNLPFVERFVDSYRSRVADALRGLVVVIDLTASTRLPGAYITLLGSLPPAAVFVHPRVPEASDYYSVQDAAFFTLAAGLEVMGDKEYLLFLEDDVGFSSRFVGHLAGLELEGDAGFYTLYQPGGGYGGAVIEPYRFYGTQCLLFPKRVVEILLENRRDMEKRFSPGYDQRWAQFLGSCGYRLYAADRSYVQHLGKDSRIGSGFHFSDTFVP